ncbi:MAG TPA: hypothetical protein VGF69_06525 [Thermoanaerobaculia bacterium]|jgi:hypothetical protein
MNKTLKLAAAALLFATTLSPSLFADSRHRDTTYGDRYERRDSRREVLEGRIRDIDRERNGFVIRLTSGRTLFAPYNVDVDARRRGASVRTLERGDYIRVQGRYVDRGVLLASEIDLLREEDDRRNQRRRW